MEDYYDDYRPPTPPFGRDSGTAASLAGYFGPDGPKEGEGLWKTFPPHTLIRGVPHICNAVPEHAEPRWGKRDPPPAGADDIDPATFRGLCVPVEGHGYQVLQDNVRMTNEWAGGVGGIFISQDWRQWMAVGSGMIDEPHFLRDRLDNGDAHEVGVKRYKVRVMETVRKCKLDLPNGERILWRKESGDTLRVHKVEVGAELAIQWKLSAEDDLDQTLREALEYNAFTLAWIGTYMPDVVDGGIIEGRPISVDLRDAMEQALIKNPEMARYLPTSYVRPKVRAMENRHRLSDARLYDDPDTFWDTFLEAPSPPYVIPWNYARTTFGDEETNRLENRFMAKHPHYMWAIPKERRTEKRVNQWLNAIEKLVAARKTANDFINARLSYKDRVERSRMFDVLRDIEARLVHPVYGNNYAPLVFSASQFARTIRATKKMPLVDRKLVKASWWNSELLETVICQITDIQIVPRALLTHELLCKFVKANIYGYEERVPKSLRTYELERFVVAECDRSELFGTIKKEHRTLEVTRAFAKKAHLFEFSWREYVSLIKKEFLADVEVMRGLCDRVPRGHKVQLYEVYPMSDHPKLDRIMMAQSNGLDNIPVERITDELSRKANISSWWKMTDAVKEERRKEHEEHEERVAYMNRSRGYYDYYYDDLDTGPSDAELAMRAERGD